MRAAIAEPVPWSPSLGGPVLEGPVLEGPVLEGPVLGGPVLGGPVLGGPVLGGPVLRGPVLGGPVLGGLFLGGLVLVTLVAGACGGDPPGSGDPSSPGTSPPGPQLSDVVGARLAELDAGVGPDPTPLPTLDADQTEEVAGAPSVLAHSSGRFRAVALESVRAVGPGAIPTLAAILADGEREAAERVASAELLASLDHPAAADVLLAQVEGAPEPWLRRWCLWHLRSTSQDQVVPRLILRLKYEQDHEAFLWLARALARFRNYSALAALEDLTRGGSTPEVRRLAATHLVEIAAEAGLGEGLEEGELVRLWLSGSDRLPPHDPSPRLVREAWRLVGELSSEHFQLRGVDDARFVLSRLGPWAAREIAAALGDQDAHVRLHTTQVLERMGKRAAAAGPALLEALADPGLAPAAAEALGRVGYAPALEALVARTAGGGGGTGGGQPHELRVAALRGLGLLGLEGGGSLEAVRAAFEGEGEPADLRMAAAMALVRLGHGEAAVPWLHAALTDPAADGDSAELALEAWLVAGGGTEGGRTGFPEALEVWRRAAGPPGVIPTLEEVVERRRVRARDLGPRLAGLIGG